MSVVRSKKTVIPISRTRGEVSVPKCEPPNIAVMQHNMEQELERRRQLWEQDVARMSEDFFQMKPGDMKAVKQGSTEVKDISPANQREVNVDVVPRESIPERFPMRPPGMEILDIHNADRLYSELEDGKVVYRVRFDVRGFEPEEIHVKIDGKKLSVSAKHEDEAGRSKSSREFKRQMDIPEDVLDDSVASHLSIDGILMVEGQVDPTRADVYRANNYPQITAFQHGEDTNGTTEAITGTNSHGPRALTDSAYAAKCDAINQKVAREVYGTRSTQGNENENSLCNADDHMINNGTHSQSIFGSSAFAPHGINHEMSNMRIRGSAHPSQHHRIVRETQRQEFTPLSNQETSRESSSQERIIERAIRARDRTGLAPINPAVETNTGIEFPVFEPSFRSSRDVTQSAFRTVVSPSSHRPTLGRFTTPLVVICEGQRKLKLCVYVGDGFEAKSIVVRCKDGKIGVYAHQEEKAPYRSKREFQREFDLPETVEESTLSAVLCKDGQITIAASIQGNSNHQVVMDSIRQDTPPEAAPLRLEI